VTSRAAAAEHLRDLARLRRVRDRIEAALSGPAIAPEVERRGPIRHEEVLHDG